MILISFNNKFIWIESLAAGYAYKEASILKD